MKEAQLYLRLTSETEPQHVADALLSEVNDEESWASIRLPDDALPVLTRTEGPDLALPDLIFSFTLSDAAIDAVTTTLQRPENAIDKTSSSFAVFTRHVILEGRDTVRLFYGLRKLPSMSLDQFHDYWLNHHADYGRRMIPPYSYHQLHADPAAAASLSGTLDIPASTLDGVVEVDFPSVAALVAQLTRPDVAEEALEDERKFIDHSRSMIWAYQTS